MGSVELAKRTHRALQEVHHGLTRALCAAWAYTGWQCVQHGRTQASPEPIVPASGELKVT
eukprot:1144729-Pelagomonas_calceolata.AAC.7